MQCKKMGREALCVFANGPPGEREEGERERETEGQGGGGKRPRVEVSRLATWGAPVVAFAGAPAMHVERPVGREGERGTGTPMAIHNVVDRVPMQVQEPSRRENEGVGRMHVRANGSRYIGPGDRLALLDHVSSLFFLLRLGH